MPSAYPLSRKWVPGVKLGGYLEGKSWPLAMIPHNADVGRGTSLTHVCSWDSVTSSLSCKAAEIYKIQYKTAYRHMEKELCVEQPCRRGYHTEPFSMHILF